MNYPPITTAAYGRIKWTCPACKAEKTDVNIHLDFAHGVVHCGCAYRTGG